MLFAEVLVNVFFELGKGSGFFIALDEDFRGVGVKFPAFAQGGERAAGVGFRGNAQVYPLVRMGKGEDGGKEQEEQDCI